MLVVLPPYALQRCSTFSSSACCSLPPTSSTSTQVRGAPFWQTAGHTSLQQDRRIHACIHRVQVACPLPRPKSFVPTSTMPDLHDMQCLACLLNSSGCSCLPHGCPGACRHQRDRPWNRECTHPCHPHHRTLVFEEGELNQKQDPWCAAPAFCCARLRAYGVEAQGANPLPLCRSTRQLRPSTL